MLYGCEIWSNLTKKDIHQLEVFQHYAAKIILNVRKSTRSDMCESMLGLNRITCEIEKRKLYFLQCLTESPPNSVSKDILIRRLIKYFECDIGPIKQEGFVPDIVTILRKYELLPFIVKYTEDGNFPTRRAWKYIVRGSIQKRENEQLEDRMNNDNDFRRFKTVHMTYDHPYTMLNLQNTDKKAISYICKMITCPPTDNNQICIKCDKPFKDVIRHFVTDCIATFTIRDTFMDRIINHYGIEQYILLSQKTDEDFLVTLFKGNMYENPEESVYDNEFAKECGYFLWKVAKIYFEQM